MHIAHPDQPVALDTIPQILLHIEVDRVGSGLPDLVQPFVVATERTPVGNVPEGRNGPHLLQVQFDGILQQVDTYKAEAGITHLLHA